VHLEILVEDSSGKKSLDSLVPRLISADDTFRVRSYKGIGRIPPKMKSAKEAYRRLILDSLPKALAGYGKTFAGYPEGILAAVVVVCDLDSNNLDEFLDQLNAVLNSCAPEPRTRFCIAIEEGEAWFLGDIPAIKSIYPNAKDEVLKSYVNDSICGTWETLADAIYPGGVRALSKKGWQAVGTEKSTWAGTIAPRMNVEQNDSPSFRFFRDTIRALLRGE
jgi:hypothetical protein